MTLRRPILALILSLVISVSFIALIQLEKNSSLSFNLSGPLASNLSPKDQFTVCTFPKFSYYPSAVNVRSVFEDIIRETQPVLISNSTRMGIYDFIVANPGIQFRGICVGLGIVIGNAEFHLGILTKAGLISFIRDGKYKRFFVSKKFSQKEMKLISLLRHETIRAILKTLLAEKTVSRSKLASNLSITSQGLTWQMNRLRDEGVVKESWEGLKVTYFLNDASLQALPSLLCLIER